MRDLDANVSSLSLAFVERLPQATIGRPHPPIYRNDIDNRRLRQNDSRGKRPSESVAMSKDIKIFVFAVLNSEPTLRWSDSV